MAAIVLVPRSAVSITLVLVVTLGGAGLAYAYLPSATIRVAPSTHTLSAQTLITLAKDSEPDFVHFQLPARIVETTVEESMVINRGDQGLREDFAKGRVVFVNDQDDEQRLLPQTHLRHEASGVFFLTDTAVIIPPRGQVTINITAKEKGERGDVPAGKFIVDKLPASVQTVVYATSEHALSGGLVVDTPVGEEEIATARDQALARLRERARGELTAAAQGALIREDLMVIESQAEQISTAAGSNAHSFTVTLRQKARAFVVDDNDLLSLTLLALRQLQKDEELVSYQPESFKVTIQQVDFARGRARVEGTLNGIFAPKIETTLFAPDNLAGRSEAEVKEYFAQFPGVGDVTVEFSPFWVKKVPSRPEAIQVLIEGPKK